MRALLDRFVRAKAPSAPWGPLRESVIDAGSALIRVPRAAFAPAHGAVVAPDGVLPTTRPGAWSPADLAALPHAQSQQAGFALRPPADTPRVGRVGAFVSYRARYSYAHLLLDAAPGLVLLAGESALKQHALLAPPMPAWRLDLLRHVLGEAADRLSATDADLLLTTETARPGGMGALGAGPAPALLSVRDRLLPLGDGLPGRAWLYIRPGGEAGEASPEQAMLEIDLEHRGFQPIAPDRMPLSEQIAAFRHARIIIGATGSALANVLFCEPGARVIELHSGSADSWLRPLCETVGATWSQVRADGPWGGVPELLERFDAG